MSVTKCVLLVVNRRNAFVIIIILMIFLEYFPVFMYQENVSELLVVS